MKYLIVSTGRCGSTFLSATLSNAGADFGFDQQEDWDRSSGSYEHPQLDTAYKWHRAGEMIHQETWPLNRLSSLCESRRDTIINDVFEQMNFAKTIELVHLVQSIHQLNFDIKIILCYRSFNGFAMSQYRRFGWGLEKIVDHYCSVNKTAFLQLQVFGGCTVSFEELMDQDETQWARALEQLTSLDRDELLEHRNQLLKSKRHERIDDVLSERADTLYKRLRQWKGDLVSSSINSE